MATALKAKAPRKARAAAGTRRAVGVVRVSRVGGRAGDSFVSPSEQRARIEAECARQGLALVQLVEELDVSAGTALARRAGLRGAVELVEQGGADVVVAAYFDRLVRSLAVQQEMLDRVEAAGGQVLAVDVGQVRTDTASHWLSATQHGMVAEYHRRVTAERTQEAKERAVARGVPPYAQTPPGYRRTSTRTLEPDPAQAATVAEAFRLRAGGATIAQVRSYLASHGIRRSYHGVQALLASRVVLGEIHFGDLVNTKAHEPIVAAATWQAVQRMTVGRGRRAPSERLLARLGVLRCGTCGGPLVVGSTTAGEKQYPIYRCSPTGDCPRRVTISATMAEAAVVEFTQQLLAGLQGTASVGGQVDAAERTYAQAVAELDAAVQAFTGLDDVASAQERLGALRAARDDAAAALAAAQAAAGLAVTVSATDDWDALTADEQRGLIRACVARATVAPAPGRGQTAPGRITCEPQL